LVATTVEQMGEPRYRCDGCGNLTRFDVTTSQTTKAFHHYTVGGELEVEEETILSRHVDEVVCRWCGHGRSVVELAEGEGEPGATGQTGTDGAAGETGTDEEREPGVHSRTS
jgi:hypothetical protein